MSQPDEPLHPERVKLLAQELSQMSQSLVPCTEHLLSVVRALAGESVPFHPEEHRRCLLSLSQAAGRLSAATYWLEGAAVALAQCSVEHSIKH